MKFELFVALRYLNSKRKGLFALITTIIGIAGVTVGVAALITTLAVMTGFQTDIMRRVIGAQSHVVTYGYMNRDTYLAKIEEIQKLKLVEGAAPNIMGQAIISANGQATGIILRGLDPELEKNINTLHESFVKGSYTAEIKENDTSAPAPLVLGGEMAFSLNVDVGDDVVLILPSSIATNAGMMPKMKKFRVSGIIKTGYYQFDSTLGYTTLDHASDFMNLRKGATGIAIKLHDIDDASKAAVDIQKILGPGHNVRTFIDLNANLYAALKLEKFMMSLILSLIIIVASLNIASNLILLGTEKLRDIGIMRAMGATPGQIKRIFIFEGLLIGTAGIICGLLLAFFLCWLIATFNIVQLPGDVYYLTKVPVKIQLLDLVAVVCGSYLLCFLAALYPALRASRVNPTDAIRYG